MASDGGALGVIHLDGVTNNDWEDLAVGTCGETTCLFIGEIGDNDRNRGWHGVYRMEEPVVPPEGGLDLTATAELFEYEYPDGEFDAEALAVMPDGLPAVFTKEYDTDQTSVYAFAALDSSAVALLERRGRFYTGSGAEGGAAAVTAADLWVDGSRLILRTYAHIWEFPMSTPDKLGLSNLPNVTPTELVTGEERQGESIAYGADPRAYYTVSEDVNPPVWATSCVEAE
jgi:hypothetical protein